MARQKPFRLLSAAAVGSAIKHYRTEAGLTQAQLAELTGISRTYLTRLEGGSENEQLRRILRILRQLGVSVTLDKTDAR